MNASDKSTSSLLDFMSCEQLDRDLFRGQSKDLKTGQVFGGQVLGQAIKAAMHTVEKDRCIRSAHAYFLLKGDVNAPIIYEVDRSLDGGSISSRRVVAIQHGRQILHLSSSFQKHEEGYDYKPEVNLPLDTLQAALLSENQGDIYFQSQFLDVYSLNDDEKTEPNSIQLWIKTKEQLPDDQDVHNSALAYISDMGLLHSALVPHDLHNIAGPGKKKVLMASIDHAIWFHRQFRADDWFFYDCRVISTGGGRGLSDGRLYDKTGTLFASTTQEGLIRKPRQK